MSKLSDDDWIWDDQLLVKGQRPKHSSWAGPFIVGFLAGVIIMALVFGAWVMMLTGGQ